VTVYRLISRDTIEEKIVALHERKRHLADSLLEGAGETSTISTEELIGLLQEETGLTSGAVKPATP
jgi:SNF2 family DNA or RNA helicase